MMSFSSVGLIGFGALLRPAVPSCRAPPYVFCDARISDVFFFSGREKKSAVLQSAQCRGTYTTYRLRCAVGLGAVNSKHALLTSYYKSISKLHRLLGGRALGQMQPPAGAFPTTPGLNSGKEKLLGERKGGTARITDSCRCTPAMHS
ncbi:hypothetical protein F4861DRAFT_290629 [Xylaria intraflava]|nr:hypothetical protein F4861DRAFT_290629 [Xylaria intraflava]